MRMLVSTIGTQFPSGSLPEFSPVFVGSRHLPFPTMVLVTESLGREDQRLYYTSKIINVIILND